MQLFTTFIEKSLFTPSLNWVLSSTHYRSFQGHTFPGNHLIALVLTTKNQQQKIKQRLTTRPKLQQLTTYISKHYTNQQKIHIHSLTTAKTWSFTPSSKETDRVYSKAPATATTVQQCNTDKSEQNDGKPCFELVKCS